MANAPLDTNSRNGITAALNTNPTQVVVATANPTTHALSVVDGSTQINNGNHGGNAVIDENGRSSWYGLASDASGNRIIVYANSDGAVLIQSV